MKPLKRVNKVELFHVVEDKKVLGNCSGLRGDADLIPLHERKDRPDIMYWVEG